jgi:cytochrome c553
MKVAYWLSKILAGLALIVLMYGFVVPSVGFHGTLERIKDGKVGEIPAYVYPLWNFYQKDRYISINTPQKVRGDLKKMIEISEEIGVPSMPVWKFSLEAPNYPKEAFPYGLPVFIHFDGLSGEVHEMNTINHYVGMAHMERGGIYERALAPYALIMLALLLALFMIYDYKWIDFLMAIPVLLPFLFMGIYGYWLYWFGHTLQSGAITIKPFMPILLGDGKVAQFTTHAYPVIGFWALAFISALSLTAWILKVKACKYHVERKATLLRHFWAAWVVIAALSAGFYTLMTDSNVNTLAKISAIVGTTKPQPVTEVIVQTPSVKTQEAIEKEREEDQKKQALKVKALENRAGSLGKFKVSQLYKSNCAPCHGVNGEGAMGTKLFGLKQDAMMQTLLDYKQHQEEMHIAVLDHMSKEEIQSVIDEISRFEAR